jgi:hypothetical protein
MFTMSRIFPLVEVALERLTRRARPAARLQIQALVNGFVRHVHFRIVRVLLAQPFTDLLRRPLFLQAVVHSVVKPFGRFQLSFLRATQIIFGSTLRVNGTIFFRAPIAVDLPSNSRMMSPQRLRNKTSRTIFT